MGYLHCTIPYYKFIILLEHYKRARSARHLFPATIYFSIDYSLKYDFKFIYFSVRALTHITHVSQRTTLINLFTKIKKTFLIKIL